MLLCRAVFISAEDSFLQHKSGLLDEAAFKSFMAGAGGMMGGAPVLRAAWRISREQYGGEFAAFMSKTVEAVAGGATSDSFARWSAALKADAA